MYAAAGGEEEPMLASDVTGDLPELITNKNGLYEGDLIYYLQTAFFKSGNLNNPYHNLRHTLHVLWLCHKACRYYRDRLTPRQMRNLLVAALFHDFDHTGCPHPEEKDPDSVNIRLAVEGLRRYVAPGDRASLPAIEALIGETQFPYKTGGDLDLSAEIIRDADIAQVFSSAWLQQVVIGLAHEWGVQPIEVLRMQKSFLGSLAFRTGWARELFPAELVAAKIEEAEQLLRLLEAKPDQ
jgi:3'5'-cyclic nucleotide phosphodiesterase